MFRSSEDTALEFLVAAVYDRRYNKQFGTLIKRRYRKCR
jgi:hypothetical protein